MKYWCLLKEVIIPIGKFKNYCLNTRGCKHWRIMKRKYKKGDKNENKY